MAPPMPSDTTSWGGIGAGLGQNGYELIATVLQKHTATSSRCERIPEASVPGEDPLAVRGIDPGAGLNYVRVRHETCLEPSRNQLVPLGN